MRDKFKVLRARWKRNKGYRPEQCWPRREILTKPPNLPGTPSLGKSCAGPRHSLLRGLVLDQREGLCWWTIGDMYRRVRSWALKHE
jgi:hypothetical protein